MADTKKAEGLCIVCKEQQTSRNCAHCGNDFVCSRDCEEEMMEEGEHPEHVIACQQRPKTTADNILAAIAWDEFPTDPRTVKDYGFDRCYIVKDMSNLLAVYKTLVNNLGVTARELDIWMSEKKLYENISVRFEAEPDEVYWEYFMWFKRSRYIWNATDGIHRGASAGGAADSQEMKHDKQQPEPAKSFKVECSANKHEDVQKHEEGSVSPAVKKEAVSPQFKDEDAN